ncbi:hypothetical protein MMC13_006893 [Lambiella insularis]|nr:hypothetical protein [Lambiella insularis]
MAEQKKEDKDGRQEAMEKINRALDAFFERYGREDGQQQFDFDVMRRARVVDATMAGTVAVEIDLGHDYANGAAFLAKTQTWPEQTTAWQYWLEEQLLTATLKSKWGLRTGQIALYMTQPPKLEATSEHEDAPTSLDSFDYLPLDNVQRAD